MPAKLTGPPVATLVKSKSYYGSMGDFNARADAVNKSYTKAYGIPPTPGLVLDLAASQVAIQHLPTMFTTPLSQQSAKARAAIQGAAQRNPVDSTVLPAANAADVASGLADAIRNNQYAQFISANHDEVENALTNPMYHDQITKAALDSGMVNVSAVLEQSIFPTNPSAFARFVVLDPLKAFAQIAGGLTLGLPVLAFKEGQATYAAEQQKSLAPIGKANVELGKMMVKGVEQDVHNPEANAGNLFLDLLGVASLGAGGVARAGAVGRAALGREGVAAVGSALVHRPAPGTFAITKGDASAETLLSDNALGRAIQRTVFNQRQAGMDIRHDLTLSDVPAGAQTSVLADRMNAVVDTLSHPLRGEFSFENKLGRTVRAELRVEQAIRMTLRDPVNHAANVSVRWGKLGPRIERGLSVGEQKAIQVLLTDVAGGPENQLAVNRAFHQRLIDLGYGDAAAHRAQLSMLNLAQQVLSKPPRPKFAQAVEDVKRVIDAMEQAKADNLGLDPTTAESRVARVGAILRGEPTHEPSYLTDPIAQAHIADLETKLAENVKQQGTYKSAPRSNERAAGFENQPRTVAEAQKKLDELDARYNDFLDNFTGGKLTPDERAQQRQINTDNAKFKRQQSGKTASGRASGASGNKIPRLQKNVSDANRAQIENEIHAIAEKHPELPEAKAFLKLSESRNELRARIGQSQEDSLAGVPPTADLGQTAKNVTLEGKTPDVQLRTLRLEESDLRTRIDALKTDQTPIALKRVNPESRYLPYTSASKGPGATGAFFGPTAGPYGIPVPGSMPELNHEFTGYHLQAGDFRADPTGLAGESYGRTVRAITKWNAWKRLSQSSVERPPTGADASFFRPIRDIKTIPDKLRAILNKVPQGELTSEEALQLSEGDFTDLEKYLMPQLSDLTPEELAHVRWYDSRVLADTTRAVPSAVGKKAKAAAPPL